uniref:Peptidylprolyl isomerase n=1 Tax=Helicotheca tamesis TaxID=374047 RepID=A0A7S2MZ86_9STRA|mmetsp:Transcript_6504/g.8805  ORF Transcript_6504/g.8805 Transcript_6504/m.8805 type:complete len:171 (+) Transcript_6504:115-627(+)|eukprot:CAMPEP_0185728592 /NCGR_PEP_ID=MMETSP1171-20130828/3939_1 /TAXON_ID=374046 /ORGANISM="Helicotheca tamensis, Strain CCMP826" /LENGTH=170 /DNA_ID=CAMNT_0028397317 /DNA_START=83 /DNA_END=595 /DNA_ORIENTATION=+
MKTSLVSVAAACAAIATLTPVSSAFTHSSVQTSKPSFTTRRNMFGGAGAAAPLEEEDPEKEKQMEAMAKAMNMPLNEYKLAMNARARFEEACNNARVSAGDKGVQVERDANAATKYLEVTITEDGKKLGKAALEKELVAAFKSSREQSKATRDGEQQKMLQFIGEESKKL